MREPETVARRGTRDFADLVLRVWHQCRVHVAVHECTLNHRVFAERTAGSTQTRKKVSERKAAEQTPERSVSPETILNNFDNSLHRLQK